MTRVPEQVRDTVLLRSGGQCERCDVSVVNVPADVHHRRPRGMGGTNDPRINHWSNLVLLCRGCHEHVERNRAEGSEHGWLVLRRDPRDPADVPLFRSGLWWWIGSDAFGVADLCPEF